MKKLVSSYLLLLAICVHGQAPFNEFTAALDKYFTILTDQQNFNGNVIVFRNKETLLDKSYSIKNGPDSLKVTSNSRFLLASVSKIYTKYGVLKLVESGKIKLTDKLNRFIPDFPDGGLITIEHLMENKSGLPRELAGDVAYEKLPLQKLVDLAKKEQLMFEPGTEIMYSNIAYFLLEFIIDKTSEKGLSDFMENEVFKKLNLNATGQFSSAQTPKNFAQGFDLVDGKFKAADLSGITVSGSGNYYSTTQDLFNFNRQLISGKGLDKALGRKLFWKDSTLLQTGGRSGYRAYYFQSIRSSVSVIFLCNYTDIRFQDITEDVMKILDKEPYVIRSKSERTIKEQPLEVLKRYEGQYALEMDRSQIFSITLENKVLHFNDGQEKLLLMPEDEFTFFDNPKSTDSFIFTLNEKTKKYELFLLAGDVKFKAIKVE